MLLLIRMELIQVTDDGSYVSNFKMEEGCADSNDVIESVRLMETNLENFMRRRMGLGDEL